MDHDGRGQALKALFLEKWPLIQSSFSITGLDVSPFQSDYFSKSIEISRLGNLGLESCPENAEMIRKLAATMTPENGPEQVALDLRESTSRHEVPDQPLVPHSKDC